MTKSMIRIANAGGYWGDDPYALQRQLQGNIDYISIDYLAEITMSILQKSRIKDPEAGYAKDFLAQVEPLLQQILQKKVKIITNAGGVNPKGLALGLVALADKLNLKIKVAVVDGDDVKSRISEIIASGMDFKNMETGEPFANVAPKVAAANVYFGALPVVHALKTGPDIVVCGRVTDTGITLAAMIHEFGWDIADYDKLAHGIVGGHIIECGAQATGGNFTDWRKVPSFIDIGFPILECYADGSFVVTKHPGTGGLVSCQTIREQLLYEMGEPTSYITPDVIADFSSIHIESDGANRVKVSNVTGRQPTDLLKVSIAYDDGFKSSGTLIISGPDALDKAKVFADVFWRRLGGEVSLTDVACNTEFIGFDATHRQLTPSFVPSEILLKLSCRAMTKQPLAVFRKLLPSMILSGPSGVAVTGGAPTISDVVSYWPALIPQQSATSNVYVYHSDKSPVQVVSNLPWPVTGGDSAALSSKKSVPVAPVSEPARTVTLPLMHIAHARSGDKGDTANIGLIGRSEACYRWISQNVTAAMLKAWFSDVCLGDVERYDVSNLWALNFLLSETLGGGGTKSLFLDAQGKTLSQALLRCLVTFPVELLATISAENKHDIGELA